MNFPSLQAAVGQVISEQPYVKLLTLPRYEQEEIVPGMVEGRWTAVAQVEEMLCVVELKVEEQS